LADQHADLSRGICSVTGDRYLQTVRGLDMALTMLRTARDGSSVTRAKPVAFLQNNETVAYLEDLLLACQGKPPING
jgi:phage terminase large subunit-like protein